MGINFMEFENTSNTSQNALVYSCANENNFIHAFITFVVNLGLFFSQL